MNEYSRSLRVRLAAVIVITWPVMSTIALRSEMCELLLRNCEVNDKNIRRNTVHNWFRPNHIISYHAPLLPHDTLTGYIPGLLHINRLPQRIFQHSVMSHEICFNVTVLVFNGHIGGKEKQGENMEKFYNISRNTAQSEARGVQKNCEEGRLSRCGYEPFSTLVPVLVRCTDL
jgi:hypothetical protein